MNINNSEEIRNKIMYGVFWAIEDRIGRSVDGLIWLEFRRLDVNSPSGQTRSVVYRALRDFMEYHVP